MAIIEHDFGSRSRQVIRRFAQDITLDALHEENIRKNPLAYLERASECIFQLEKALFEAREAARYEVCADPDAAAHLALLRVRVILERALALCSPPDV